MINFYKTAEHKLTEKQCPRLLPPLNSNQVCITQSYEADYDSAEHA